jgi:hypothetical protein
LFSNLHETTLNQSTSPNQDYLNINVTALVQDMVDNPNSSFGFRLALVNEAVTSSLSFCSSEFSNTARRPSLAIEYRLEDAAVQTFSYDSFQLYPNPTQNMLYLNFSQDANKRTVDIYDMQGKIVLQTAAQDKTSAIDVQFLNTGMYTIVVKDEMSIYRTDKFHKY